MSSYTASGARRTGDEYQDLQSAEILIEWLEQPDAYRWIRLETTRGSLDDIQAERSDGKRRLLQVKFGTDSTVEWDWDELMEQKQGKKKPLPSLLQKWKNSLDQVLTDGVQVSEAAVITNRSASAAIRGHLSDSGLIDFLSLSVGLQARLSGQLGGSDAASLFFASFHFYFKDRSRPILEATLLKRFSRLGGTSDGWVSLMAKTRHWINRKDEPSPDGTITLADVRDAALWHLPPQIPQGFLVPEDYVPPENWSVAEVVPRLSAGGDPVVVVTGNPGVGKSTYLSWLVEQLRGAEVPVVRHHYFLSMTDATSRRTDWKTAADAIIGQLRSLYGDLVSAAAHENPLPGALRDYLVAAGRERSGRDPVVVIVDGLDHVWRDTGNAEGLRRLLDLLLPAPNGVVLIIGTQDIDVSRVPRKLRDTVPREQWLRVPALNEAGVHAWLKYHEKELGLPEDDEQAAHVLNGLADAFLYVTGGHPLILHYTLNAARQRSPSIRVEQIQALPAFDPSSRVATYYQALWDDISPEGHQLLHLLAGFPWAWPREGLVQCLASQADHVLVEQAECAIRHVLGKSHAGVTAFHESLLVFVRALSAHPTAAQSLRPRVVDWLSHRAPEYWRWRHEWQERAGSGDREPLICSATLEWCVDSLAAGRSRTEIAQVVAASGWAALEASRLGVATERHYLDKYLADQGADDGCLSALLWLALRLRDPRSLELELDLFLSNRELASDDAIEAVAEVAFCSGHLDSCNQLFRECVDRWRASRRADHINGSPVPEALPSLIAATLTAAVKGRYQRFVSERGGEPDWCPRSPYLKALARLCALGEDTGAAREEMRFLANHPVLASHEAVEEIVRLACRDGFDANGWVEHPEARSSGLFRCYRLLVFRCQAHSTEALQPVSFRRVWLDEYIANERLFVDLARSHFFYCLACAMEGFEPENIIGVDAKATKVVAFLFLLHDLAYEAARRREQGEPVAGAWLVERLASIEPPQVEPNDFDNRLAEPLSVARVMVVIAQDLEDLHFAHSGSASLTADVLRAAIDSPWSWPHVWIEDRVARRLTMRDPDAARLLIERERRAMREGLDYLHSRAADYVSLAQFCHLHRVPVAEVQELMRLAARNLLGHGYHKDMVLLDVLGAIRGASRGIGSTDLQRLRSISPVIQVIDDITDGDETRHVKRELAETVCELVPEALPSYLRALQRDEQYWDVESCITDLANNMPLETVWDRALASTFVHERALVALKERADSGDSQASSILAATLRYCNRQASTVKSEDVGSGGGLEDVAEIRDEIPPPLDGFPPQRLAEFVQAVRDARRLGDDYLAQWTTYWRSRDPDGLLDALTAYREAHGEPIESKTAKAVVELAFERSGRSAAWEWLIAYHNVMHGWSLYTYRLIDVKWIWDVVRSRYRERWLEFIVWTCRPRWETAGGAPAWSPKRMVQFLAAIGELDGVDEVVDAAVRWGAGLAADMQLPDHALTPELPRLPVTLRLLADRLDCPSRMVQERAAWCLSELLTHAESSPATLQALLGWHSTGCLELRSCTLLLILHLAQTAHGLSADFCLDVLKQMTLVPSIGVDLLRRGFSTEAMDLAAECSYRGRHSGRAANEFPGVEDFRSIIGTSLAPIFDTWAVALDRRGIPFSTQWQWEAVKLADEQRIPLSVNAHLRYYYVNSDDKSMLALNDRLSLVLRSAYLRALHWAIDEAGLEVDRAEVHTRRVAVMADPELWAVRPTDRPDWWPADQSEPDGFDTLGAAVGEAVKRRLLDRVADTEEVLLFAAGPVGNRPDFRAELRIEAYLQSAHGPLKPSAEVMAGVPWLRCKAIPPRLFASGTYTLLDEHAGLMRDWLVAPLAWTFLPNTEMWLIPDRQTRQVRVPASWLFPCAPVMRPDRAEIRVMLDEQQVARYRYWNDELRERHFFGVGSRVGGELLIRREWLAPQLAAGASLCWVATLTIAQREKYKEQFGPAREVGTWVIGGSHIVWPEPWQPRPPASWPAAA